MCNYKDKEEVIALAEIRFAIERIVIGKNESVELLSCIANLRKFQHELIKFYNL